MNLVKKIINKIISVKKTGFNHNILQKPDQQMLDIYWNEDMAKALETWGKDNAWIEIQLFFCGLEGKTLDIACGTGIVFDYLKNFSAIDLYGCDISDYLIQKAVQRGIPSDKLKVEDATKLSYEAKYFDYSYSIGSLEHFTEEGIMDFLVECKRVTKKIAFHQIPVSKSNYDEGWISPYQSYFNNSEAWWLSKFGQVFSNIIVLPSKWNDDRSVGKWFVCYI